MTIVEHSRTNIFIPFSSRGLIWQRRDGGPRSQRQRQERNFCWSTLLSLEVQSSACDLGWLFHLIWLWKTGVHNSSSIQFPLSSLFWTSKEGDVDLGKNSRRTRYSFVICTWQSPRTNYEDAQRYNREINSTVRQYVLFKFHWESYRYGGWSR